MLGTGDRVTPGLAVPHVWREVVALWLATGLLIRAVVALQAGVGLPLWILAAIPLLFIYGPVALCRWRGVDSYAYRLGIPGFSDWPAWRSAGRLNLRVIGWLIPAWLVAYHLWQTQVFGLEAGAGWPPGDGWPLGLLELVGYHLFFIALPEEFFYRGYLQTRLNEIFPRKWLIFGVPMGWGAVCASVLFAFGHTLVEVQWWHFATFFPGLVFAWMRERSGGVVAGAGFHAFCNVAVICMDRLYGL